MQIANDVGMLTTERTAGPTTSFDLIFVRFLGAVDDYSEAVVSLACSDGVKNHPARKPNEVDRTDHFAKMHSDFIESFFEAHPGASRDGRNFGARIQLVSECR
jgi:hypothetical protein